MEDPNGSAQGAAWTAPLVAAAPGAATAPDRLQPGRRAIPDVLGRHLGDGLLLLLVHGDLDLHQHLRGHLPARRPDGRVEGDLADRADLPAAPRRADLPAH